MKNSRPILLIEDDDVDTLLAKRAINELKLVNPIVRKINGEDGLAYLRDKNNEKPCIILLDLNMPRMNGFEFLKIIKADEAFKKIPVIILTTSDTRENINDSFALGAAGYIIKPVDYQQFIEAMRTVNVYWSLNQMPDMGR